jgi:hypothetical protein
MIVPSGEWEDMMRDRKAEENRQLAMRRLAREVRGAGRGRYVRRPEHALGFRTAPRRQPAGRSAAARGNRNLSPRNRITILLDSALSIWGQATGEALGGVPPCGSQCCEAQSNEPGGGA